ncbi:MAG: CapA family protein [Anaerolineales bacterium]
MKFIWVLCALSVLSACNSNSTLTLPPPSPTVVEIIIAPQSPAPAATAASSPTPTPTSPPTATASTTPTAAPVSVSLMAVGDVMLARSIGDRIVSEGAAPFGEIAATLRSADITIANLECAISERGEPQPKAYVFRAPPLAVEALSTLGVDVVSLANNHTFDFGLEALVDTVALLNEKGIASVGVGGNASEARTPVIVERNGLRMAFLAYVDVPIESRSGFDTRSWIATDGSPGLAWAYVEAITADVVSAKQQSDMVVVLLHFGFENRAEPTAAQRSQARAAVDAGATLVIGAHPHVLQGAEEYGSGLIAYSLGNFVFDGFEDAANDTAILKVQLGPAGVEAYEWTPAVIKNGFPRLANGEEAARILRSLQRLANP